MSRSAKEPGQETDHAIGGLVRVGVIETVDLEKGLAVVVFGENKSPPIQWLGRAGELSLWSPPSEGEQVLVVVPENDIEQGVILGGLFSTANPPAGQTLKLILKYLEGAEASYDPEAQEIRLTIPGKIIIEAENGIEITADVKITGDIDVTGGLKASEKIEATVDVIGAGKSLKGHKHLGVSTGPGISGVPQ